MTEAVELNEKYNTVKANEQRWESSYLEDADYIFIAYGLPGRAAKGAVEELRAEGYKVGFIRPITAWPFPEKAFSEVNKNVKGFISVEANATGQLIDDIALTVKRTQERNIPVYCKPHVYGIPSIKTIKEDFQKVISGEMKEVY